MLDTDRIVEVAGLVYLGATAVSAVAGALSAVWAPAVVLADAADRVGASVSRAAREYTRAVGGRFRR